MIKEFEKLKNDLNFSRQEKERKIKNDFFLLKERIKKDKILLEESGIKELFEEIRDNGIVKWDDREFWETTRRTFGIKKERISYIPAKIVLSKNDIKEEGNFSSDFVVSISLRFNHNDVYDSCYGNFSEVKIISEDGHLFLSEQSTDGNYYKPSFTEIFKENLPSVISQSIRRSIDNNIKISDVVISDSHEIVL